MTALIPFNRNYIGPEAHTQAKLMARFGDQVSLGGSGICKLKLQKWQDHFFFFWKESKPNQQTSNRMMLCLESLRLEGFKCFAEAEEVGPFGPFTCAIGVNGSGKSTIVEVSQGRMADHSKQNTTCRPPSTNTLAPTFKHKGCMQDTSCMQHITAACRVTLSSRHGNHGIPADLSTFFHFSPPSSYTVQVRPHALSSASRHLCYAPPMYPTSFLTARIPSRSISPSVIARTLLFLVQLSVVRNE